MNFKKLIGLLLFIFTTISSHSQNNQMILKFSPLALVDVINSPVIQGGVEFRLSNRISWYNELGIKYRDGAINQTDSSFIKSNGFTLKSEARYYLQNKGKRHFSSPGYYFAANVFFIQDNHNTQVEYHSNNFDAIDAFGVKKTAFGMNILAGRQFTIYKGFMLDMYCGVGFRFRNITTVNEEYNNDTDTLYHSVDVTMSSIKADIDANPGTSIVPNFTMGFRLCYKL